jgi:hypothetical protein
VEETGVHRKEYGTKTTALIGRSENRTTAPFLVVSRPGLYPDVHMLIPEGHRTTQRKTKPLQTCPIRDLNFVVAAWGSRRVYQGGST